MANELDELMARIADDPTMPQPGDIDKLIAYYRNRRAELASGIKPKRVKASVSLDSVVTKLTVAVDRPATAAIKRRV